MVVNSRMHLYLFERKNVWYIWIDNGESIKWIYGDKWIELKYILIKFVQAKHLF